MPFPKINTLRHAEVLAFRNLYRLLTKINCITFDFHNYLRVRLPTNRGYILVLSYFFYYFFDSTIDIDSPLSIHIVPILIACAEFCPHHIEMWRLGV